ncbi:hypothetical protein K490DRAFT_34128, partial [Saccharata proteae CBS 121410]
LQNDARKFRRVKETTLRGLRVQKFARTNQFEVERSWEGFVEKFIVLNRDDLASALEERLKELSKVSNKWTPEILSLLFQLSDNPVQKAKVEDLEKLRPPTPPPALTWAEIIADDPLEEDGLWDDIDYAAESSEYEDEDEIPTKPQRRVESRAATPPSSAHEEDEEDYYPPEALIEPVDTDILKTISANQFWTKEPEDDEGEPKWQMGPAASGKVQITELEALRETLFMLAGLGTSLFKLNTESGRPQFVSKYAISHALGPTFAHQMHEFSAIGLKLNRLRSWTKQPQYIALLQTFQYAIEYEVREFNKYLAALQGRYLGTKTVEVSLLEVHASVQKRVQPLLWLESLVSHSSQFISTNPFAFLEALYEQANLAQASSNLELFMIMTNVFFLCLRTYLRPIRQWMESGELGPDDNVFFIAMADKSNETASLWHDRYALRQDKSGRLHAPSFLRPAAKKIFNSGKSVVFLKELNRYNHKTASKGIQEPSLDFASVCGSKETIPLAPFSELFAMAFENWIASKYTFASSILRKEIYSRCGLWRSLDSLEYLYFSRDGSLMQTFADTVFEKLDRGRAGWNDRYILTEVARSTYNVLPCVDEYKLVVRTSGSQQSRDIKALDSISLDYILPWSITNIVQRASIPIYQRIFIFLLQIYRAKSLLKTTLSRPSTTPPSTTTTVKRHTQHYLRHRLTWLVDLLYTYITELVLAPAVQHLRKQLTAAEDLDAMAALHTEHVKSIEAKCLLAKKLTPIHQAVLACLDLSTRFAQAVATEHAGGANLLREEFMRQYRFLTAGLRGVSRAGGETCWEMLAERLEWDGGAVG